MMHSNHWEPVDQAQSKFEVPHLPTLTCPVADFHDPILDHHHLQSGDLNLKTAAPAAEELMLLQHRSQMIAAFCTYFVDRNLDLNAVKNCKSAVGVPLEDGTWLQSYWENPLQRIHENSWDCFGLQ